MPALDIYIDPEQMREVTTLLKGIGRESTPTLVRSVNSTIVSTRVQMVKITGQRYNLSAARIKKDYSEKKANKNNLNAYVRTDGNPIGLINYKPGKKTSEGISWKIMKRGPRTKSLAAFYALITAGRKKVTHILQRDNYYEFNTGKPMNPKIKYSGLPDKYREPISVRYGPANQNALTRPGMMEKLEVFAADRVATVLDQNVKFLLSKAT